MKFTIKGKVLPLIIIPAFFLIFLSYLSFAAKFLSPEKPIEADALIVEGWLDNPSLESAAMELCSKNYRFLIVTGFPYYKGITLGSSGALEIKLLDFPFNIEKPYDIKIGVHGTEAKRIYAHFNVFINDTLVFDSFSTKKIKFYHIKPSITGKIKTLGIEFDNDTYTRKKDRNLIIHDVEINGRNIELNTSNASLYIKKSGKYIFQKQLGRTVAEESALVISKFKGCEKSVIPVGSIQKKALSKTFSTALQVRSFIDEHPEFSFTSLNIFTKDFHARRSLVSFRKVFRECEIGVISLEPKEFENKSWWNSMKLLGTIVRETLAVLFIWLYL